MAISPNDTFTSGQILTAQECNQFPFGVVALTTSQTSSATISTAETVMLTSSTFTALANRYYRITYFEPVIQPSSPAPAFMIFRIRLTNTSGTVYQYADVEPVAAAADGQILQLQVVTTLAAGSTVIVATGRTTSNTFVAYGNAAAGATRQILVEDIGPA